jgi:hypothetical protein
MAGVFVELAGRPGAVEFRHSGPIAAKVGVTFWLTVIINVVDVAHCPAVGVKVYVVVAVLFNAGDQVPVMPLVDVAGNAERAAPEQIGSTAAKVGVTFWLTVIVNVVDVAHCPAVGVKV